MQADATDIEREIGPVQTRVINEAAAVIRSVNGLNVREGLLALIDSGWQILPRLLSHRQHPTPNERIHVKIIMRATYTEYDWPVEGDADYHEGDNYPRIENGYADIHNPWGGFDAEVPEALCGEPFVAWRDENVKAFVLDDTDPEGLDEEEMDDDGVWHALNAFDTAARFIESFEGGVWDLWESEPQVKDYRTGISREVTLHVEVAPDPFTQLLLRGMDAGPLMGLLDPLPRLFAEAERLRAEKNAHLRALAETRYS